MQNKPVIFLDIDGVLITNWSEYQAKKTWFKNFVKPFNPISVEVLNFIIETFEAEIVLTSDWRHVFNEKMQEEFFNFNGINYAPKLMPYDYVHEFKDVNKFPNRRELKRSKEIETYVKEYKLSRFVIIDDMNIYCFPNHFVQTISDNGLEIKHKQIISEILKQDYLEKI